MSFELSSSRQAVNHENPQQGSSFERVEQKLEQALAQSQQFAGAILERWERQMNSVHKRTEVSDIDEAANLAFGEIQMSLDKAKDVLRQKLESLMKRYPKLPLAAGVATELGLQNPDKQG